MKKIIFILTVLICFSSFGQSKLGNSKKDLTAEKPTASSRSSSDSSSSDTDVSLLSPFVDVLLFVPVAIGKYVLIGDYKNENHLENDLSSYPFHAKSIGNYQSSFNDSITSKWWRFDLENHFIYSNNDLFGNHLEAKARASEYFSLQADYFQIWEINRIENTDNRLSLFYFNIGYDRIRLERFNFGWTLGASYVGNEVKKAGFSYGLKTDYFLQKNLSLGASAKWSFINQEPVHSYQIQSRFHKKNFFLGVSFEHLKIAKPVYNFVGMGGGIYF